MKPGVFPVPCDQFQHGGLVDKGQRPLDDNRANALYNEFCSSPYVDLTTPGVCIIVPYAPIDGKTLLDKFENTPKDIQVFTALMKRSKKCAYGAQHGVKAQCLAYERHNRIAMDVLDGRGGIGVNCYDFSHLDEAHQNKYVTYLVSEHGDVQLKSKERTFMEVMFTTRVYLTKILKVNSVAELYTYLDGLHPDDCEAERQLLLEKGQPQLHQQDDQHLEKRH